MQMISGNRIILSIASLAFSIAGCDQSPPAPPASPQPSKSLQPATPTTAPAATQLSDADAAALRDMIAAKAGGRPAAPPPAAPPRPSAPSSMPASGTGTAAGSLPPGHPPVPGVTGEIKFTPPEGWQTQTPRSTMRKAQYALPRAEGDPEDGEVVVFFFGAREGGNLEDNLARWRGQFKTADGKPVGDDAVKRESITIDNMKVTLLEVNGRYDPGMMPGAPARGPSDNFRMIAAVVESPGGNWFIKATGPSATMAKHEAGVRAFLNSVRR